MRKIAVILLVVLLAIPCIAEDTLKTYIMEDTLVIYGKRLSPGGDLGISRVIDADDVRGLFPKGFGDVLSLFEPVTVVRYGDIGQLTLASTRRGSSEGTQILIDGFPLVNPHLGTIDLSLIPTSFADRIEMIKGGSSWYFSPGGLSGAVNIMPKIFLAEHPVSRIHYGAGERGYEDVSASIGSVAFGRLSYNLSVSRGKSSGFRENEKSRSENVVSSIYFEPARNLGVNLFATKTRLSLDTPGSQTFPVAGHRTDNLVFSYLKLTHRFKQFVASAGASVNRYEEKYSDCFTSDSYDGEIYTSRVDIWSPELSLFVKLDGEIGTVHSTKSENKRYNRFGGGVGKIFTFSGYAVSPFVRVDMSLNEELLVSGFLGVEKEIGGCELHAYYSGGKRSPTMNELYWNREEYDWDTDGDIDYGTSGNPELVSELSHTVDVGGGFYDESIGFDLFYSDISNLICWQDTVPDAMRDWWMPVNFDEAKVYGGELFLDVKPLNFLRLFGNLSVASSKDKDGKVIPYSPLVHSFAFVELSHCFFRELLGGSIRFEADVTSGMEDSAGEKMADVVLLNLKGRIRLVDIDLFGVVENITDKSYELRRGYPLPGRTLRCGLEWELWD